LKEPLNENIGMENFASEETLSGQMIRILRCEPAIDAVIQSTVRKEFCYSRADGKKKDATVNSEKEKANIRQAVRPNHFAPENYTEGCQEMRKPRTRSAHSFVRELSLQ